MDDVADTKVRFKLDVDAYYAMAEAGILSETDRVELIDGELIEMAAIGRDHAAVVDRINQRLVLAFAGRAIVSVQNPLRFDRLNEPEPDFSVLRPRDDFYATGERAKPSDVLLVIEVANSSLRYDQLVKRPLYARNGIAEFWIVNIQGKHIEVCRQPTGERYGEVTAFGPGEAITLALAPEVTIAVDDVFG